MGAAHYGTKPGHFETSKIHFPMSEEASERVSGASEQANGRASGPVLTSRFLFVPDHSAFHQDLKETLTFSVLASAQNLLIGYIQQN